MFLSSALPSMLLLPVAFCTSIHKHECDLNIGGSEGANVIVCYNICDGDCSSGYLFLQLQYRYRHFQDMWTLLLYIKHNFLGAILDFLGKGSFFNVEIRDTEMYSEPVGQAFK